MDWKRGKKRRYFSSNLMAKKGRNLFLKVGIKGFICTCNGNEKQCIRESYNILNEYADQVYGEEMQVNKPASDECQNEDADNDDELDAFKKEVQSMQSENVEKERRFQALDTGIANCIFVKTNLPDPVNLAHTIMKDLADKKQLKSRFLLRMVPVEVTCKAYLEEIMDAARPLFDTHFKTEPVTYGIVFSKRCNSNLDRDAVIEKLAAMVQERNSEHKVNLTNPTVSILVEAMKNICGLAVIREYFHMSKYNLRQLCGVLENDTGDGKKNSAPDQPSTSDSCDLKKPGLEGDAETCSVPDQPGESETSDLEKPGSEDVEIPTQVQK